MLLNKNLESQQQTLTSKTHVDRKEAQEKMAKYSADRAYNFLWGSLRGHDSHDRHSPREIPALFNIRSGVFLSLAHVL